MKPVEAAALGEIDWSRPWLTPWRERGETLAAQALRSGVVDALNAALDGIEPAPIRLRAGPLRFVDQGRLPAGEAYESFIARTACVPTRSNLHDFLSGLAWLAHPALKQRLNELQAEQLAQGAHGASRGAVRDALTLFDENAALLQAPPVLLEALRQRDWQALFVTHRAVWAEARIELFGHALLEKLVRPRKAITAHVWVLPWPAAGAVSSSMQDQLAQSLAAQPLASKPFLPLPVLGVPGWWAPSESPAFYRDDTVFRGLQKQTAARGPLF